MYDRIRHFFLPLFLWDCPFTRECFMLSPFLGLFNECFFLRLFLWDCPFYKRMLIVVLGLFNKCFFLFLVDCPFTREWFLLPPLIGLFNKCFVFPYSRGTVPLEENASCGHLSLASLINVFSFLILVGLSL